jgi:hypothetical protein
MDMKLLMEGKIKSVKAARTFSEAVNRSKNLLEKLRNHNINPDVLKIKEIKNQRMNDNDKVKATSHKGLVVFFCIPKRIKYSFWLNLIELVKLI